MSAWRLAIKKVIWMVRGVRLCPRGDVRAFLACRRTRSAGKPVELRVRGLPFALLCRPGTSDGDVLWDTFGEGFHRPPVTLAPDSTILDLGANVGYTAVDLAARHPGARVIAVELDEENAALAARNLRPFGERCVVVRAAVWSRDGEVAYDGDSAWGLHVVPGGAETRRTPALRVSTLLGRLALDWVDYVKMDIEGAEEEVLGDDGWLKNVGSIKVEIHPPATLESCASALRSAGFHVVRDPRHTAGLSGWRYER